MERLFLTILKSFYGLLIYVFTAAGLVSLRDDMFGVREQCKSWKSCGYETVNVASPNDGDAAKHSTNITTFIWELNSQKDNINHLREYLCRLANSAARMCEGVFLCPEAHRIRLRVCSD